MSLIAIVGATGTGKSDFALDLAVALEHAGRPAEIVNADAMQLYRGMDIGTAKLSLAERRGVPHHLLDVLEVTEDASVAAYQSAARDVIDEILARGAVALLVGGSGLYVSSVIHDFRFPGTDPELRARLEAEFAEHGPGLMHARLRAHRRRDRRERRRAERQAHRPRARGHRADRRAQGRAAPRRAACRGATIASCTCAVNVRTSSSVSTPECSTCGSAASSTRCAACCRWASSGV